LAIGLPTFVEVEDLFGAGLLGLLQALDKFDPTRNIKFETYAIPRIRGAMLDELRSQDCSPTRSGRF
jgi:RNA polymerase sigma factor for flagellar operon FliA